MENSKTQKVCALLFIITLIAITEVLIYNSQTFQLIKFLAAILGFIAILYYLFIIGKVFLEE
ncbi:hypothetical protein [Flavobacterium psychrophilum]|uniref:hypothetical protein n=1 Tax=Flavobacterium psychrophilum TaxID=96345 RepID=UPI001D0721E8|nr:hypothetical protein [Flavobacterium psychrophilum]MCB6088256.1 hypothetical protein [Flavobacterium psychrophilum]MEB3378520.1 hypothetical protein [Flavobacterium psychrophilum]